ncbi:MAG: aminomethyl-transferring glycine dehydrogenase subunit GcvPB [Candidatus Coatesbacteria bacterium]|nr:aminomethyl-transferring glycine dehydrogenase subunit GcvPB [Candidatus Coatesbacteria bacterium]
MNRKLIFELSKRNCRGYILPEWEDNTSIDSIIPQNLIRNEDLLIPELTEGEVIRHFTNLSACNHSVDKGFYPLGSCTMKYNPRYNEKAANYPLFSTVHPYFPSELIQLPLMIMYELEEFLKEITGMKSVTLQPAAGAHGEFTGVLLMRAYFNRKGEERKKILIPDSAHGTNPASCALGGFKPISVNSSDKGGIDLNHLQKLVDKDTAALMLTNPNTLGIFESNIASIREILNKVDALLYMDGANLNALLGYARPYDLGFDLLHINLHKTFSTPHGGGGPGSGPVAVNEKLADFLPVPNVRKENNTYYLDFENKNSIGSVMNFWGNFGVIIKAYCYIRMLGGNGLKKATEAAVLNSNYLRALLKDNFKLSYETDTLHEFVLNGSNLKNVGIKTIDLAKALLDYGFHAPTIYFPLIVKEAIMIEPTETETKETLDCFACIMNEILRIAEVNPEKILNAPHKTPVGRLDEGEAVKRLNICYFEDNENITPLCE